VRVAAFYHCWCGGAWREPTSEFLVALDEGGFDGELHVGLVGSPEQRAEAVAEIRRHRPVEVAAEADWTSAEVGPWEEVTISAVAEYAERHDGAVLYCHTKGSWHTELCQDRTRRMNTEALVLGWRECLTELDRGYDVVLGGGNFWMARCDYLRRLPRCEAANRFQAEGWISLGREYARLPPEPYVAELAPPFGGDGSEPRLYRVDGYACPACPAGNDPARPPVVLDADGYCATCPAERCPAEERLRDPFRLTLSPDVRNLAARSGVLIEDHPRLGGMLLLIGPAHEPDPLPDDRARAAAPAVLALLDALDAGPEDTRRPLLNGLFDPALLASKAGT
jgi:hypothetical protein